MLVEEYQKSKGGRSYYSVYNKIGSVLVSVADIKAESKEEAKKKAEVFLKKTIDELAL